MGCHLPEQTFTYSSKDAGTADFKGSRRRFDLLRTKKTCSSEFTLMETVFNPN